VARLACGERISGLPEPVERRNVAWVLALPWLDPPTRALFLRAQASLYPADGGGDPTRSGNPNG
jgi:hypothetical protein